MVSSGSEGTRVLKVVMKRVLKVLVMKDKYSPILKETLFGAYYYLLKVGQVSQGGTPGWF